MVEFTVEIWGKSLRLQTAPVLFSPRQADRGTLAMLAEVSLQSADRVLDLGCGYGLVGLAAAAVIGAERICMIDIDPAAIQACRQNITLNGLEGITLICGDGPDACERQDLTWILSNPPYHTDFRIARQFIEQSFRHLAVGGKLVMVVKRLDWYRNKMISTFGGVHVVNNQDYFVLTSEKRQADRSLKSAGKTGSRQATSRPTTRKHLKKLARQEQAKPKSRPVPSKKAPPITKN